MKSKKSPSEFILWNPAHHTPPTARFATRKAAEQVAARMAQEFSPERFYVCELVAVVQARPPPPPPVRVTELKRAKR